MLGFRICLWLVLGVGAMGFANYQAQGMSVESVRDLHLRQLEDDDAVPQAIRADHWTRNTVYAGAIGAWVALGVLLFAPEIAKKLVKGDAR